MSNAIHQTNTEKHSTATLGSIYAIIEEIYEIADGTLDGKVTKATYTEDGDKVQVPFTHKEALEFVAERASLALMEVDDLKRQIEVLAIHHETKAERDYLTLPVVDLERERI